MRALCDCDQSFEVHPPGYHGTGCAIWGPRYNLPDDYEFSYINTQWEVGPWYIERIADYDFIPKFTTLRPS